MKKPVLQQRRPPPPAWPWDDVHLEPHEVSEIKAMAAQHPAAFETITQKVLGLNRLSFTSGGEDGRRATDFGEGMKFGGRQLIRIRDMKMPVHSRGAPPELPNSPTPAPTKT